MHRMLVTIDLDIFALHMAQQPLYGWCIHDLHRQQPSLQTDTRPDHYLHEIISTAPAGNAICSLLARGGLPCAMQHKPSCYHSQMHTIAAGTAAAHSARSAWVSKLLLCS